MNRDELLESAKELKQVSKKTSDEFISKKDRIASILNEKMLARDDLERLIGKGNDDMMEDNSRNMLQFMNSLFVNFDPETLVETVIWVFRAYRSHGFHMTYWAANLDTVKVIMKEELDADSLNEIEPYFNWLIVNIPSFVKISDGIMDKRSLGKAPSH